MAETRPVRLLYLTAEQWPTFRPDMVALFGKYLPRLNIASDLLTERNTGETQRDVPWGGGNALLCDVPKNRAAQYWVKFWHQIAGLLRLDAAQYDAIQVRDLPVLALWALLVARAKGLPFFYWMSFPQSEGQILRARTRGPKAGIRYWFPLLQGLLGKWVLYRWVLPAADHIFVQSRHMAQDVALHGIPLTKITPVPMGVDLEIARPEQVAASDDPRLVNKRVLVYLGTLDPARHIEMLFNALRIVRLKCPSALLVLAGDTEDSAHRQWLRQEAQRLGVADAILWSGWLPAAQAWRYVRAAEIGLSPCPRSFLFDCASPTKPVEYMALGIPVVASDNPDQAQIVAESGAGLCVPQQAQAFADAITELLNDSRRREQMGARGLAYVRGARSYGQLAAGVAKVYQQLSGQAPRSANQPDIRSNSIAIVVPELLPVPAVHGGAVEYWVDQASQRLVKPGRTLVVVSRPAGVVGDQGIEYLAIPWTATEKFFHRIKERVTWKNPLRYIAKFQNVFSYGRRVAKAVQDFGVVYLHNEPNVLLFLAKRPGQKIVLHMHNDHLSSRLLRPFYRRALAKVDRVICVSDYLRRSAVKHFPEYAKRFFVVLNATDATVFRPYGEEAIQALHGVVQIESSKKYLLYVGRLNPVKGVHILIEAFRTIHHVMPDTRLIIAGSSFFDNAAKTAYEQKLAQLAEPVSDAIIFSGYLPHHTLKYLYSAADIVVFPSVWQEPFGFVMLEAMAAGTLLVASAVGGIPEVVENGIDGVLIEPANVGALAQAVCRALNEPEAMHRMESAARQKILDGYTWERLICELEEILDDLNNSSRFQ